LTTSVTRAITKPSIAARPLSFSAASENPNFGFSAIITGPTTGRRGATEAAGVRELVCTKVQTPTGVIKEEETKAFIVVSFSGFL